MSQYPKAKFIQSANEPKQFVSDVGVEICFAGRSNSGKSKINNKIQTKVKKGFRVLALYVNLSSNI